MRGPERGFAILIVLWALVLLTLLFTQLTATGRGETRIAANLYSAAAADAAASGAVYQGLFHLLDSSAAHWKADGVPHDVRLPAGSARITITDEAGLVNPNSASASLLQALLHVLGEDAVTSSRIAAAIVGWRTPDAQAEIGPDAYRRAGLGYVPPLSPFQSIEELSLVLGMTPSLMTRLRPHVSIYNAGAIDPALADPMVREALLTQDAAPRQGPEATKFPRNVAITVSVTTRGGAATQRAEFRLNPPGDGKPFAVMTWQESTPH